MSISPFIKRDVAYPAAPVDKGWPERYKFILINDMDELRILLKENESKPVAFDTETTGLDYEQDKIVGFSLSWDGITGYYIPIRHAKEDWNISKEPKEPLTLLHQMLLKSKLVFYANRKFDDTMLEYENWSSRFVNEIDAESWGGYSMKNVNGFDVTHFCYICDTDNFKMIGLKAAAAHFLGIKMMEFSEASGGASFRYVNPKDGTYYAASDAICTFRLGKLMLNNGTYTNMKESGKIDNSFVYVLAKIEREKTKLNFKLLEKFENQIMDTLNKIEKELFEIAGYSFNLRSPKQVEKLFLELGIDTGIKTETGSMSVGAKAIESMSEEDIEDYPFLKKYVKYKKLEKLRSSYIEVLIRIKEDNRDYARVPYKANNTATGRLASGAGRKGNEKYFSKSLNIQNIPKQKPAEYYVFDCKDRGLWYEDIIPDIPLILLNGYLMTPVWYRDGHPINPKINDDIAGEVNSILEAIEDELGVEIGDFNSIEYLGITESGSTDLNIRSLFIPEPIKNEKYTSVKFSNGITYYFENDGIDGIYANDEFFIVEEFYKIPKDCEISKIVSGGTELYID